MLLLDAGRLLGYKERGALGCAPAPLEPPVFVPTGVPIRKHCDYLHLAENKVLHHSVSLLKNVSLVDRDKIYIFVIYSHHVYIMAACNFSGMLTCFVHI